jgi:hypothetical protein
MEELSPLVWVVLVDLHFRHRLLGLVRRGTIRLGRRRSVDKLQDLISSASRADSEEGKGVATHQGSSGDDTRSSGEEVSPDNVLQH